MDTHNRPGESDSEGDHKQINLIYRNNDFVASLKTSIDTPQQPKNINLDTRDTSNIEALIGYEEETYRAYIGLEYLNGQTLTAWQDTVKKIHKLGGFKKTRTSLPSSDGFLSPVSAFSFDMNSKNTFLNFSSSTYTYLTMKKQVVGNVFDVSIPMLPDKSWATHPYLFPNTAINSTTIYTGLDIHYTFNDLEYAGLDYKKILPSAHIGSQFQTLGFGLSIQYDHYFTSEVNTAKNKRIDTFTLKGTHLF